MSDYRGSVHCLYKSTPTAATVIRRQAREIDGLWDRLSRAYALIRQESPAEIIQDEMEQLRAMLDERQQLKTTAKALQAACKDPERP